MYDIKFKNSVVEDFCIIGLKKVRFFSKSSLVSKSFSVHGL